MASALLLLASALEISTALEIAMSAGEAIAVCRLDDAGNDAVAAGAGEVAAGTGGGDVAIAEV